VQSPLHRTRETWRVPCFLIFPTTFCTKSASPKCFVLMRLLRASRARMTCFEKCGFRCTSAALRMSSCDSMCFALANRCLRRRLPLAGQSSAVYLPRYWKTAVTLARVAPGKRPRPPTCRDAVRFFALANEAFTSEMEHNLRLSRCCCASRHFPLEAASLPHCIEVGKFRFE